MVDGWFPDINSKGEIISGSGQVWLTSPFEPARLIGSGVRAKFVTDDLIVYAFGYGTHLVNIRTNEMTLIPTGYNMYAGGNGDWAGIVQKALTDVHIYRGATRTIELMGYGIPVMAPDGSLAIPKDYAQNVHEVLWNGVTVFGGTSMNLSVCNSALAIQVATSMYGRNILGVRRSNMNVVENWTLYDWEDPVVCDGPDGPWVLSVTQFSSLVLRPAGETLGYKLEGEWYNPAVRFIDGRFLVAGSSSRGQLMVETIYPSNPRVDLKLPPVVVPPDKPVEPPKPQRPVCTIRSYPDRVILGSAANCKATYAGGPADSASWLYRKVGASVWLVSHKQVPPEPEHNYRFKEAGNYEISLKVEGAGGSDQTGSTRLILVEEIIVPPEPEKPARQEIAFGPNLGSNIGQLFTEEELWDYSRQRISCFQLYVGHIISPGQDFVGQNTFDNLKQSGIFRKLREWGVLLELQMASGETPNDVEQCVDKIEAEQGELGAICFDHAFIESTPEAFAERLQRIKGMFPDMIIGAYVPYPTKSAEDIRKQLVEWDKLEGRPDFLRIDCDPNQTDKLTKAEFADIREMTQQRGMSLQMTVNAGDSATTDAEWVKQAKQKFDFFLTLGSWDAAMVQSWALVPSAQDRQLPRNLLESESDSHTALVKYCLERFRR